MHLEAGSLHVANVSRIHFSLFIFLFLFGFRHPIHSENL